MAPLTLEIVEGPSAGRQILLAGPLVLGRSPDCDVTLDDGQVSRRHARVTPASDGSAVVEDLGSANGTFVNRNQVEDRARLDPGDELQLGLSVIEVRSREQVAAAPSALRPVPPALAATPRQPDYVNPEVLAADNARAADAITPQLDRYLDVRVRRRAQLAPLALLMLIALALCIYFATR